MTEIFSVGDDDEAERSIAIGGVQYPLANRGHFGLGENGRLGALLRRMSDIEALGSSPNVVELLRALAAIAVPSAPAALLRYLDERELSEICVRFLSWSAGHGTMAKLAALDLGPATDSISSLPTLIAIVLRDTTPLSTIVELFPEVKRDFLDTPDDDQDE